MKFYVPDLAIATLLVPQQKLQAKFGGTPWGFPVEQWPICRECSTPMALLAQLPHAAPALDLGDDTHVLHLFQCPTGGCASYDFQAGCTASIVLHQAELGQGLTDCPAIHYLPAYFLAGTPAPMPSEAAQELPLNGEVWITGWTGHEDGISDSLRAAFFDYEQFFALPDSVQALGDEPRWRTKCGSAPLWNGNGVATHPAPPYDYLMQINTSLVLPGPMPAADAMGCDARINQADGQGRELPVSAHAKKPNAPWFAQQDEGADTFYVEIANFGTDGTAYVFINRQVSPPAIVWSWSR